jgi:alpha-amylase
MRIKVSISGWARGILVAVAVLFSFAAASYGQAGFDDDRVMLQGFYWESYRHGHAEFPQFGTKHWYKIVEEKTAEIRDGHFDLVWLPPPSFCGGLSAGYNPQEYFNLNNSYGDFNEHLAVLHSLLQAGVEPIADLVLNHRNGSTGWVDFKNPDWDLSAICADDECFSNPASGVAGTPMNKRGAKEEGPRYRTSGDYAYDSFRDIDHSNVEVRKDIVRHLLQLKSAGYKGWRYDMVHGYAARWLRVYNRESKPTFSVGEYDWDKHSQQRGWVWDTAVTPDDLKTASSVFDFTSQFTLKDNKGKYAAWYGFGNGVGMMGDTTDGHPWKNRAVTFLENHDTGYRTNPDGTPEGGHAFDSFSNTWEVEQAYAYILTHPGVPCVFWKHYFDWGSELHEKIKALTNARKIAGVKSGSALHTQNNAQSQGIYAAMIEGANGSLYVRIGGTDAQWQPSTSGYQDYRDYAHGAGWTVWVGLPGNPDVKQAGPRPAFQVDPYQDAKTISVTNQQVGE